MNLLQLIKQKEEILSNTDKKIVDWIIDNPNEALKFSIKQIAFKLKISISSITNFF